MTTNPDGYISFLKPGSNDWKALDSKSFIYWRDYITNESLEESGDSISPAQSLTDGENESPRII